MKNRNLNHKDDWATPDYVYRALDKEFNFNFDPCPLHSNFDGLSIEWKDRNYINPPYSLKLKIAFVKKAIEESKKGKLCVMLLPVSTSTKLFQDLILPNANEIRFVKGRIPFEGINTFGKKVGKGSAPMHDSMVVVFKSPQSKTQAILSGLSFNMRYQETSDEVSQIADATSDNANIIRNNKIHLKINQTKNEIQSNKHNRSRGSLRRRCRANGFWPNWVR